MRKYYKRICAKSAVCPGGYDLYKADYKAKEVHYWSFRDKMWTKLNWTYFGYYKKPQNTLIRISRQELFLEIL